MIPIVRPSYNQKTITTFQDFCLPPQVIYATATIALVPYKSSRLRYPSPALLNCLFETFYYTQHVFLSFVICALIHTSHVPEFLLPAWTHSIGLRPSYPLSSIQSVYQLVTSRLVAIESVVSAGD